MLVLLFYAKDAAAAKLRSREIAADKPNVVRTYDVGVWSGNDEKCDAVVIMPDVTWQRSKIEDVFKARVVRERDDEVEVGSVSDIDVNGETLGKRAVHRGFGKWYVMLGDEQVSGPHKKAEAEGLAAS